jgi:hypothetical protein
MFGNQQTVTLDAYVQRLSQMTEPVTMWTLDANGEVIPHFQVDGAIIQNLMVDEATLRSQVDRIASEQMHWGRITARQQRCHAVRERQLRQWKARVELEFRKAQDDLGKKTTEAMVEAHYRTAPEYAVVQVNVEACAEAAMVADVIYSAFRSKREMLRTDIVRVPDGSLQRLSP